MKLKFTVGIIIIFSLSILVCKPKGSKAKIWLEKNVFQPNEEILVHFTVPINYQKDAWVGIVPSHIQHGDEAINDEYKALSTYEAVIAEFGSIRPFVMIKGAEEQHIASLKAIYDKYGLEIPDNTWPGKVSVPATIQEACQVGVDAEIANAALYKDNLLPAVQDYEDITVVFTNLMNASEQKHLPAFDNCN